MKTLNLYNYTNKDGFFRTMMTGVCHRDGYKCASDSRILVLLKTDYDSELEGKVIAKDGTEILTEIKDSKGKTVIEKYPNFFAILPKYRGLDAVDTKIDFAKLKEIEKMAKENKSKCFAYGNRGMHYDISVAGAVFRLDYFLKLAKFMQYIGADTLTTEPYRAAYCKNGDNWGLLTTIPSGYESGFVDTEVADGVYYHKTFVLA